MLRVENDPSLDSARTGKYIGYTTLCDADRHGVMLPTVRWPSTCTANRSNSPLSGSLAVRTQARSFLYHSVLPGIAVTVFTAHSYLRCRHGLFGPPVKLAKRTLPSGTTTSRSTDSCFSTGPPIESTIDPPPTCNARAPSLPVGGLEASLGEIEAFAQFVCSHLFISEIRTQRRVLARMPSITSFPYPLAHIPHSYFLLYCIPSHPATPPPTHLSYLEVGVLFRFYVSSRASIMSLSMYSLIFTCVQIRCTCQSDINAHSVTFVSFVGSCAFFPHSGR
ncbi:hypothetical protein EDD17DRAFT_1077164 [Pisolithus thermaeus]|nr:hypothetical protein EDD17DRAFT_1077164 [Pisolithus thermaeus]